jgi:hypothetical protein
VGRRPGPFPRFPRRRGNRGNQSLRASIYGPSRRGQVPAVPTVPTTSPPAHRTACTGWPGTRRRLRSANTWPARLSRRLRHLLQRFQSRGWMGPYADNFNQLRNKLMPPDDQAFSALLEDLEARGPLETTPVIWAGEFGREPEIARPGPTSPGQVGSPGEVSPGPPDHAGRLRGHALLGPGHRPAHRGQRPARPPAPASGRFPNPGPVPRNPWFDPSLCPVRSRTLTSGGATLSG